MVEVIGRCTSLGNILRRLDELPPKLDALYEETMKRIEEQDEDRAALAGLVLTWVVHAFQPLTVEDV